MRSPEDLSAVRRLGQHLSIALRDVAGDKTVGDVIDNLQAALDNARSESKPKPKRREKGGHDRQEKSGEERDA